MEWIWSVFPHSDKLTPEFQAAAMHGAGMSLLRSATFLGALAVMTGVVLRMKVRVAAVIAVLLALVAADVWTFSRRYLVTFEPAKDGLTPAAVEFLRQIPRPFRYARAGCYTFPQCEGMTHGFTCLEGIQPNVPGRFRDMFWILQEQKKLMPMHYTVYSVRYLTQALRMLNLCYLVQYVSNPRSSMEGVRTVFQDDRVRIDQLPGGWPRAWLVHQYRVIPDGEELLEMLSRWNYEAGALLEEEPGCPVKMPAQREPWPVFTEYAPDRVELKVRAASSAILVVSDLCYPGWTAEVDGQRAPILRANYLMRAVPVPAGEHTVRFTYAPASFRNGAVASACGGLIFIGLLVGHYLLRKERTRAA
jgi:hypothetical protein